MTLSLSMKLCSYYCVVLVLASVWSVSSFSSYQKCLNYLTARLLWLSGTARRAGLKRTDRYLHYSGQVRYLSGTCHVCVHKELDSRRLVAEPVVLHLLLSCSTLLYKHSRMHKDA